MAHDSVPLGCDVLSYLVNISWHLKTIHWSHLHDLWKWDPKICLKKLGTILPSDAVSYLTWMESSTIALQKPESLHRSDSITLIKVFITIQSFYPDLCISGLWTVICIYSQICYFHLKCSLDIFHECNYCINLSVYTHTYSISSYYTWGMHSWSPFEDAHAWRHCNSQ